MAEEEAIESALRLKALGNDLIREGDCASAAVKYHEALRALAFDGAGSAEAANLDRRCRLNLASCYIRMGEWEDAVEQCDLVLAHFPACSKALCKRAQSREAAGELADALADYTAASKLMSEAESEQLQPRIARLERLMAGGTSADAFLGGENGDAPFGGAGDLLRQMGGAGGAGGGDFLEAMTKMSEMFGGGPGGGSSDGLGALSALSGLGDLGGAGLLPPGVKRMLAVLQFVLKARQRMQSAWKAIEPFRPYIFAAVLLLPAIRYFLGHARGGLGDEQHAALAITPLAAHALVDITSNAARELAARDAAESAALAVLLAGAIGRVKR